MAYKHGHFAVLVCRSYVILQHGLDSDNNFCLLIQRVVLHLVSTSLKEIGLFAHVILVTYILLESLLEEGAIFGQIDGVSQEVHTVRLY